MYVNKDFRKETSRIPIVTEKKKFKFPIIRIIIMMVIGLGIYQIYPILKSKSLEYFTGESHSPHEIESDQKLPFWKSSNQTLDWIRVEKTARTSTYTRYDILLNRLALSSDLAWHEIISPDFKKLLKSLDTARFTDALIDLKVIYNCPIKGSCSMSAYKSDSLKFGWYHHYKDLWLNDKSCVSDAFCYVPLSASFIPKKNNQDIDNYSEKRLSRELFETSTPQFIYALLSGKIDKIKTTSFNRHTVSIYHGNNLWIDYSGIATLKDSIKEGVYLKSGQSFGIVDTSIQLSLLILKDGRLGSLQEIEEQFQVVNPILWKKNKENLGYKKLL